jgi:TRAP-type C4-dicarboxylate transport system substrate-binding protein
LLKAGPGNNDSPSQHCVFGKKLPAEAPVWEESMIRKSVFAALCGMALLAPGFQAQAAEVTLSALNALPPGVVLGEPFSKWVEEVNREGKGIVQIQIRSAGSMTPFTMGPAVRDGVVDMAGLPPNYYQNLLPIGEVEKLATKGPKERRENGTWELMNKLHEEKLGLHYLGTYGWGVPFHIYLRAGKKPDPAKMDLSGYKIRISPVYRAFFTALGAELLQAAPADIYQSLERGVIDGYGWPIWDIQTLGLDKATKYRIDPGFYWTNFGIIINNRKWQSLSKEQKDFLTKKAVQLDMEFEEKWAKPLNAKYAAEQQKAGIEVIKLEGKQAQDYLAKAREAGWAEFEKLDPENAAKFRKLIN